jgi:hypothetical protein
VVSKVLDQKSPTLGYDAHVSSKYPEVRDHFTSLDNLRGWPPRVKAVGSSISTGEISRDRSSSQSRRVGRRQSAAILLKEPESYL